MSPAPRSRRRTAALAVALAVVVTACGDDAEDATDDAPATTPGTAAEPATTEPTGTTEPMTTEPVTTEPTGTTEPTESTEPTDTTEPTESTEPQAGSPGDFCTTVIAAEAVASAGPAVDFEGASEEEIAAAMEEYAGALVPLLDQLVASVPDEVADDVATIDAALRAGIESGEDPFSSPDFMAADAAVDQYVLANCGFEVQTVTAADYRFDGVPDTLPAGTIGFDFRNEGLEVHEMVVFRVNDGVDATIEELLALPEDEVMSMVEFTTVAFAAPGERAAAFADLEPGRYAMLCFIPLGATSMAELEGGLEGEPHFMHGMVQEFTVA